MVDMTGVVETFDQPVEVVFRYTGMELVVISREVMLVAVNELKLPGDGAPEDEVVNCEIVEFAP